MPRTSYTYDTISNTGANLRLLAKSGLLDQMITPISPHDAIEHFLMELKIEARSTKTIRFYRQNLEHFLKWAPVDLSLHQLTNSHLREYFLAYQRSQPTAVYALAARYRALRALWNWAIKEDHAVVNPVLSLKHPKLPRKIIPTFSDQDIQAMLKQCDPKSFTGARDRAVILVFLDTGMRLSESAGLKLGDVDMEHGLLRITGKGNKQRLVRLSTPTHKVFWHYLRQHKSQSNAVWLTEEHRALTAVGIHEIIRRRAAQAGLTGPRRSCHTFRHTFAVNFLRRGGDIFSLQTLGGWDSLDMVRRYTQTLNSDDALRAHEKFSPVEGIRV